MNKTKKLICEAVLLAIEELKANLEATALKEDVKANANAIKTLAEAYEIVKRS